MIRDIAASTSRSHRFALATPLLFAAFAACTWASDGEPGASDQLRADCRAEGEAGGLEGAELEAYIRECLIDLQSVEIRNIEQR